MFFERLKVVGKNIAYWTGMFAVVIAGFALLIWLVSTIKWLEYGMYGLVALIFGLCLLCAIIMLLIKIWTFIKWLFVEPYKNWRKSKSDSC